MSDPGLFPDERVSRKYPPEVFTQDQVVALMNACSDTVFGRRLRALISVLYRTGVAISEALQLRVSDVDMTPGRGLVHIVETALVPRTLAIEDDVCRVLRDWLTVREPFAGDFVFCSVRGGRGGSWAAGDARRQFRALEPVIGRRVNAHSFRLTLVAELMTEQWPLSYIQTQLGLSTIWSLRNYFPQLGIAAAPEAEVAEIVRARPNWARELSPLRAEAAGLDLATGSRSAIAHIPSRLDL